MPYGNPALTIDCIFGVNEAESVGEPGPDIHNYMNFTTNRLREIHFTEALSPINGKRTPKVVSASMGRPLHPVTAFWVLSVPYR